MDNIAGGPQQKGKRGCFSLAFIAPPQYSTGPQPRGPHWAYGFSGGQQENWKWHSASLTLWKLSCKILQGLITQGSPEETWKPVHTVYLKVAKRVDHKRFHHILLLLLLFTKKQLCEVIEVVSNSTVIVCSIHVYHIIMLYTLTLRWILFFSMLFFNYISIKPGRGNGGDATKSEGAGAASEYGDSEPKRRKCWKDKGIKNYMKCWETWGHQGINEAFCFKGEQQMGN